MDGNRRPLRVSGHRSRPGNHWTGPVCFCRRDGNSRGSTAIPDFPRRGLRLSFRAARMPRTERLFGVRVLHSDELRVVYYGLWTRTRGVLPYSADLRHRAWFIPGGEIMTMPSISVIMPTYNRADMLRGALESLLCQETGGEFEYEIVVI